MHVKIVNATSRILPPMCHTCVCFDTILQLCKYVVKFIYSEKAAKFCEIFTLLLSYVLPVKSKVKMSPNFVAFSECMNFITKNWKRFELNIMNLIFKEKIRVLKYFNPGGSHKTAFPVCLLYKSTQSVFFRKPQRADDPLVLFMATKSTMTNKFHLKLEF